MPPTELTLKEQGEQYIKKWGKSKWYERENQILKTGKAVENVISLQKEK